MTRSCSSVRPTAKHGGDNDFRDRLMVIESALVAAEDPVWTVAGLDQGVQTRALALDIDDEGHYVLAGYSCFDACEPVGEVRVYAPGGTLVAPTTSLGPLGSPWFGPHDIAWSPAGYAVVALGELQGQNFVFKVQAVAPGVALPLWTYLPNDKQGLPARARGGGRPVRRGLWRRYRRRRSSRLRAHRRLTAGRSARRRHEACASGFDEARRLEERRPVIIDPSIFEVAVREHLDQRADPVGGLPLSFGEEDAEHDHRLVVAVLRVQHGLGPLGRRTRSECF
jgi:hypothetical protein